METDTLETADDLHKAMEEIVKESTCDRGGWLWELIGCQSACSGLRSHAKRKTSCCLTVWQLHWLPSFNGPHHHVTPSQKYSKIHSPKIEYNCPLCLYRQLEQDRHTWENWSLIPEADFLAIAKASSAALPLPLCNRFNSNTLPILKLTDVWGKYKAKARVWKQYNPCPMGVENWTLSSTQSRKRLTKPLDLVRSLVQQKEEEEVAYLLFKEETVLNSTLFTLMI